MQLKYRLPLAIFATAVIALGRLNAQVDDDEDDEFTTMGFFGKSPQELNVTLKLTEGAQVKFGNLGNLPNTFARPVAGAVGRSYMDGSLSVDARRPYSSTDQKSEYSATGDVLSTEGGRYQYYDSTDRTKLLGDYLSFTEGYTRSWSYTNQSQTESYPGFIAMNIYSARTQGASVTGSRGYTGGVELSVARKLAATKRITFSIVAGLSLSGINSSKSGTVDSTLLTFTDLYSLHGNAAPFTENSATDPYVRYKGPTFPVVNGVETENTVPLSNLPDDEKETTTADAAHVKGNWKIRGAYFTLKVGPQVTAMITRNIGLTAGFGLAGSYAGTTYTADESFTVDGITNPSTGEIIPISNISGEESASKNTLLAGYYANIDATWDLNERTGLFAGVSYDNLGNYSQTVGGRTAKIDLNSTAGVRGGLSIKF